ncbi:MAG TPA: hypothetical protein VK859_15780 [bacterium]|jgi:hypothetical protein|nr:hypothetical protein [bacterium]
MKKHFVGPLVLLSLGAAGLALGQVPNNAPVTTVYSQTPVATSTPSWGYISKPFPSSMATPGNGHHHKKKQGVNAIGTPAPSAAPQAVKAVNGSGQP